MFKNFFKKSFIIFFALSISFSFLACTTNTVKAGTDTKEKEKGLWFFPAITIGDFIGNQTATGTGMAVSGNEESKTDLITGDDITVFQSTLLPEYIKNLFSYGYGIATTLAVVMVAIGGVIWLTSGGNQQTIGKAKSYITSAIIGIVLLMGSYLILANVNTSLVNLEGIEVMVIKEKEYSCCQITDPGSTEPIYISAFSSLEDGCKAIGGEFKPNYSPDLDKLKCEENFCGIITYTTKNYNAAPYGGMNSYTTEDKMCIDTNSSVFQNIKKYFDANKSVYTITSEEKLLAQACSEIASCSEKKVNCVNKDYGDWCSNFIGGSCHCYDGIPYIGEAGLGEPCGNNQQGLSFCQSVNRCGDDEKADQVGGRTCKEGLRCCRPKNGSNSNK